MTLRVGENIIAGGGSAKDNLTIVNNENSELQVVGKINQNMDESATHVLYDWVGTLQEYQDQNIELEHPEWICFITDDEPSGTTSCLTLLEFKWSDRLLNDVRWLNADTFSWQDGRIYQTAYLHLLNDLYEENVTLYCWASNTTSKIIYTRTETPIVDSWTYDENGVKWKTISSVNNDEIDVLNAPAGEAGPFIRNTAGDTTITVTLGVQTTETIDGTTITYYIAPDGHRICMPNQEAAVQTIFENTGVAWFYILDTTNSRFKLPRTKFGFTGLRNDVGDYVEPGLPSISHTHVERFPFSEGTRRMAEEYGATQTSGTMKSITENITHVSNDSLTPLQTEPNTSVSSIYGNSTTVQPAATEMYLYFYVGEFSQSSIEQTAGITEEQLNGKMDAENFQVVTSLPANPKPNVFYFLIN